MRPQSGGSRSVTSLASRSATALNTQRSAPSTTCIRNLLAPLVEERKRAFVPLVKESPTGDSPPIKYVFERRPTAVEQQQEQVRKETTFMN